MGKMFVIMQQIEMKCGYFKEFIYETTKLLVCKVYFRGLSCLVLKDNHDVDEVW